MPSDPLYARIPAQLAIAIAVVAQIDTTTTAWPWLIEAGESPTDLTARLAVLAGDLRARVSLSSALADCETVAYADAAPTLEKVDRWRRLLRQRLRACDTGSAVARAAAAEIRKALKLSPLRLAGTLQMLPRAVAALERNLANLPPEVHGEASAAEGEQFLTALLRCDDTRRKQATDASAALAAVKVARAAMVQHLRLIRWKWRMANDLAGGALPKLNLSAGLADIA